MRIENLPVRYLQSIVFSSTGNGDRVGDGNFIFKNFTLQVKGTGVVDSWSVLLEGSLDGTNFEPILTHTKISPGDGGVRFDGDINSACIYFRVRVAALSLGAGTGITVTSLGL